VVAVVGRLTRTITLRPESLVLNISEACAIAGLTATFARLRGGSTNAFLQLRAGLLIDASLFYPV
jgi:hypothetical protein